MTDKIEICVLSSGDKPCLSVGSTVVAGAWNGRGSTVHTFRVSVEQLERLIAEHKDRNAPHTAVQLAPVPQTVKAGGFKMGDRIEYVNYSGVAFPGTVTGFSISLDDGDSLDCVCAADLRHMGKDENE